MENKKFRFYHQLESVDCGPACLAMVARYYGKRYSLKQIKSVCSVTRMGVSISDITNGAKKMGFEATGAKLTLEQLHGVKLPIILFWKQDHFIVLYRIKKNKNGEILYYIADPGYGTIQIESNTIASEWMGTNSKGVAIIIQNSNQLSELTEIPKIKFLKTDLLKLVLNFVLSNKLKYILSFILLIIGLIANWALPIVFKKIIDDGIIGKSLNLVWILLIAQFILFVSNFISQLLSDLLLTKLNFRLSVFLKENLLFKLLRLPISYFDTRLNSDTLQRLNDQNKIQSFLTWKSIGFLLNVLNLIVFSIILFSLNVFIFLIFTSLSIISIIWVSYFLKFRAILEYTMFLRQSENNNNLYEFVMNMPEIKVSGAQNIMINKLIKIQKKLNQLELKSLFLNMYQLVGANFFLKT